MRGYEVRSGDSLLDELLVRGGLEQFYGTFILCFLALCTGGLLAKRGLLLQVISPLAVRCRSFWSLGLLVLVTGFLNVLVLSEIYLGILVTINIFLPIFQQRNIPAVFLSRWTEESTTLLGPLVPWTTAAIFMQACLGVSAQDYLWFSFYNWGNVLLSLLLLLFRVRI